MKDTLLQEALADAKAVKELALQNARQSLEESFRPQLSSMLSARLRNEIDGSVNEDNDASSEIGGNGVTVDEPAPKKPSKATSDSSHIKNPGLEVEPMGEAFDTGDELDGEEDDLGAPAPAVGAAAAPAPVPPAAPAPAVPSAPAAAPMGGEPDGDELGAAPAPMGGESDVLDLEAIIRELELDLQGDDQLGAPPAPAMESFKHADAGKDAHAGIQAESTNGANDKDGPDMPAVDGVNGGKKVTPGQEVKGSREGIEEEVDLDEILREIGEDASATVSETERLAAENASLRASLQEHRSVVVTLHERIKEINMLNAKLLYTNKLFHTFGLTEAQKKAVVENFDRAVTPREVKIIFTTLAESLNGKVTGNNKRASKGITEGFASKPVASTAPKSQPTTILAEGDDLRARFMKLANISNS